MNETIFEQVESFASVLKLDFSAEEFAQLLSQQNQPVPQVYVEQLRVSAQIA